MFIAAVAHIYSFPHYPFHINSPQYWNNPEHNWCRAFLSMMDITDMQEDVSEHLGVVTSSISRRFQGRSTYQPLSQGPRRISNENEYLINKRQDGDGDGSGGSSQLLMVPGGDEQQHETGRRKLQYTKQPQANAHRYGATDKLVFPIYDDAIASQSQTQSRSSQQAGTSNNNNNQQNFLHQNAAAISGLNSSNSSNSNFGGISIQKREPPAREYSAQHHYGAPMAGAQSYLQMRNVAPSAAAAAAVISPIPESGDDLLSLASAAR